MVAVMDYWRIHLSRARCSLIKSWLCCGRQVVPRRWAISSNTSAETTPRNQLVPNYIYMDGVRLNCAFATLFRVSVAVKWLMYVVYMCGGLLSIYLFISLYLYVVCTACGKVSSQRASGEIPGRCAVVFRVKIIVLSGAARWTRKVPMLIG